MNKETLVELAWETRKINDLNGWEPTTEERLPSVLALIHSEISEAWESEGFYEFAEEIADICIRVLDLLTYPWVQAAYKTPNEWADVIVKETLLWEMTQLTHIPTEKGLLEWHWQVSRTLEDFRKHGVRAEGLKPLLTMVGAIIGGAAYTGIELEVAIREKLEKNRHRGFKHGGKRI